MKSVIKSRLGAILTSLVLAVSVATPAMAVCDNHKTVAGIRAWYYGMPLDADCSLTGDISDNLGLLIGNIIYDLMMLAGLVALGYIIYGGYLMVLSGGDAGKYAQGKKTLTGAIIGLVICLCSLAIIAFLSDTLQLGLK